MTTIMQKAITPQLAAAYLEGGYDRVAGFVVRAADVAFATTPARLFEAHGLGFPGSPFAPDDAAIHVLRFPATPQLRFEDAIGGTDPETRARTGGPFIDRPPFTGLGFVPVPGALVPLYWLVHSRIPAGSELVRVTSDGAAQVVARFVDVAQGWVSDVVPVAPPASPAIARFVGPVAVWRGGPYAADPLDDGTVVLATEAEPEAALGFERTDAGRWRRVVPAGEVAELFELNVTARWNGLEMRVVDSFRDAEGQPVARVSYTGHDADLAEGLRLQKVDAGVYEASVPMASLADVTTAQLVPRTWAR